MNLENAQNKHLQEIERLTKELLTMLLKAKLGHELICNELAELSQKATKERQARFDKLDNQFQGY
jgi:hypothetical protein